MKSVLDQLKEMTVIVADTGDFEAIEQFAPMDATTNPSLLLKAAQLPQYAGLVEQSKTWAIKQGGSDSEQLANCSIRLGVGIGSEILKIIPGRVSTEVDSKSSFDTKETIEKAKRIIELYAEHEIAADRILIKIASTWEGIRAAEVLEKEGINCNLTLLFGFAQATACADAGVFLISPFVGRILDWYRAKHQRDYDAAEDPGVLSVARIYDYYKQHGYQTIVMGASFRSSDEIKELAGCDRLTISPALLDELSKDNGKLERRLSPDNPGEFTPKPDNSENQFRWSMNEDAMATEKLAEGIRNFSADQKKLEQLLATGN